jgi:hypothetical protein
MGEMFDSLRASLNASDLKGRCSLRFIDIVKDSDPKVNQVRQQVESGYSLPLTALNGKWSFYGGISNEKFYAKVRDLLAENAGDGRTAG